MREDPVRINSAAWTGEVPHAKKAPIGVQNLMSSRAAAVAVLVLVLAVTPLVALYEGVTRGVIPLGPTTGISVSQPFAFAATFVLWLIILAICLVSSFILFKAFWQILRKSR